MGLSSSGSVTLLLWSFGHTLALPVIWPYIGFTGHLAIHWLYRSFVPAPTSDSRNLNTLPVTGRSRRARAKSPHSYSMFPGSRDNDTSIH